MTRKQYMSETIKPKAEELLDCLITLAKRSCENNAAPEAVAALPALVQEIRGFINDIAYMVPSEEN